MSVNAHKADFGPPMTLGNMREALFFTSDWWSYSEDLDDEAAATSHHSC